MDISKMAYHPLNLALRFLLELSVLFAAIYWAWTTKTGLLRYMDAIFIPVILAAIWGIFAVPNDKSRSGKTVIAVSGTIRLILEFLFFGLGTWFFCESSGYLTATIFAAIVVIHYLLSFDRMVWLLKQA